MKSLFVESNIFENYRELYLSDDEYRLFQADLMVNPKQGDVIQGTGGLRKYELRAKEKVSVAVQELYIITWTTKYVFIYSLFTVKMK
ncbi:MULTISPECIES: hypothetical protein [Pseudoalteromonas]|jgi:hypothetical protein|uniref:hypothetical protein n=1 Tax=Pseudoalteromonas TaxID=53246 RepID=UPI001D00C4D2|nr:MULTISPECIES: hypothetical protein [Pseudoalteromonas]